MKKLLLLFLASTVYGHDAERIIRIKHDCEFSFDLVNHTHFIFRASVPQNEYLSIGLSKNMFSSDMIIWQANGQNSKAVDLWSRGHFDPSIDEH